jgi:hypothetical protein
MKTRFFILAAFTFALAGLLTGCATKPSAYDYTNFNAHPPVSILVLPPLNESTDVRGTYGFLSTVSRPLAEMGYYVYPVEVVDNFMKENGLPTAGDMHQVSLQKIREVIGADAVLYVTLKQYGSKYQVVADTTIVAAEAKLVDTRTGLTLWDGAAQVEESSSSGNLIGDLITAAIDQAINSSTDQAHGLSGDVNYRLYRTKDHGLLPGPYFPKPKQ